VACYLPVKVTNSFSFPNTFLAAFPLGTGRVKGLGTGQIRRKVKEDEKGIGITDAGSLSLKAGEGAGVANR
jgi:hypothetical protein